MRAVILVVSDKEKDTASTAGMETSRLTSPLLQHRAAHIVEPRLAALEKAFIEKDFETFGRITMQDSNQFHAVCLDTFPPIFYLNDTSKAIMRLVAVLNEHHGRIIAAYTFDAGPNAVIYCLDEFVPIITAAMSIYFPARTPDALGYCNKPEEFAGYNAAADSLLSAELKAKLAKTGRLPQGGDVQYVFLTKVGCGPIEQPATEHLIDVTTGLPVEASAKHKRLKLGN